MQPTIFSADGPAKVAPAIPVRFLPEPLRTWSGTRSEYPRSAAISVLFEEVAKERPDAIALVQDEGQITHEEWDRCATRLAISLRDAGIKPERTVGCYFERSAEMIVAFLAVLKAGGAYVPLDPAYPKARLDFILQDAGQPVILTRKSLVSSVLPEDPNRIILLDDESVAFSSGSEQNPRQSAGPTSVAYVMYTSGSTGRPKGVMVEHRGIVRLVRETNYCRFGPDETFLQFAPMCFDASTFEIWGALLNGSRLVLMPLESSSPEELVGGVDRGYLNNLDATSGKFLTDPFAEEPNHRMYRTGDLARWRPDGTIEFLGRMDSQVKILGYRIEPAEIETVLQRHGQVKQACVVAQTETAGKRLAAYFVPSTSGPTPEELREFVASQLPHHMVPAFFVALPSLPLSEHGKVDRKALAALEIAPKDRPQAAGLPGNQLERTLAQLWQRILKVPNVGLDDNSFDLGGDSLLLVALHSNFPKLLQIQIALKELFEFATIRKLAQHLGHAESVTSPLSDVQERAQRQRGAFTRFRGRRSAGES